MIDHIAALKSIKNLSEELRPTVTLQYAIYTPSK